MSVIGLTSCVTLVYLAPPVLRRRLGDATDLVLGIAFAGLAIGWIGPVWMARMQWPYLADAREREFLAIVHDSHTRRNPIVELLGAWWYWLSDISTRVGSRRHG